MNAELIQYARAYAEAIDKDRTFETGLTQTIRALAGALERAEKERDSLRLERDASEHNRRKDNEHLLAERDRLHDENERLRAAARLALSLAEANEGDEGFDQVARACRTALAREASA